MSLEQKYVKMSPFLLLFLLEGNLNLIITIIISYYNEDIEK